MCKVSQKERMLSILRYNFQKNNNWIITKIILLELFLEKFGNGKGAIERSKKEGKDK